MPINIARIEHKTEVQWGIVKDDSVLPIPGTFETTGDFIAGTNVNELKQSHRDLKFRSAISNC